jgi:hypothetical protein
MAKSSLWHKLQATERRKQARKTAGLYRGKFKKLAKVLVLERKINFLQRELQKNADAFVRREENPFWNFLCSKCKKRIDLEVARKEVIEYYERTAEKVNRERRILKKAQEIARETRPKDEEDKEFWDELERSLKREYREKGMEEVKNSMEMNEMVDYLAELALRPEHVPEEEIENIFAEYMEE